MLPVEIEVSDPATVLANMVKTKMAPFEAHEPVRVTPFRLSYPSSRVKSLPEVAKSVAAAS